jgi:hypothetical protein
MGVITPHIHLVALIIDIVVLAPSAGGIIRSAATKVSIARYIMVTPVHRTPEMLR